MNSRITILLFLLATCSYFQGNFFTGRVVDPSGIPMDSTLVSLVGSNIYTTTGADGKFVLETGTTSVKYDPSEIFPEPELRWNGSQLTVQTSRIQSIAASWLNLQGRLLYSEKLRSVPGKFSSLRIPFNLLKSNISILKINTGNRTFVKKIILSVGSEKINFPITNPSSSSLEKNGNMSVLDTLLIFYPRYSITEKPITSYSGDLGDVAISPDTSYPKRFAMILETKVVPDMVSEGKSFLSEKMWIKNP